MTSARARKPVIRTEHALHHLDETIRRLPACVVISPYVAERGVGVVCAVCVCGEQIVVVCCDDVRLLASDGVLLEHGLVGGGSACEVSCGDVEVVAGCGVLDVEARGAGGDGDGGGRGDVCGGAGNGLCGGVDG